MLSNRGKDKAKKVQELKKKFVIALSLAVVLGLGWALGLLATSSDSVELTTLFQVLFSIFVGMQGVLIFFLHAIRNADARALWKKCIEDTTKTARRKLLVSTDSTFSGHGDTFSVGLSTLPRSTLTRKEKAPKENTYESTVDEKVDMGAEKGAGASKSDPGEIRKYDLAEELKS